MYTTTLNLVDVVAKDSSYVPKYLILGGTLFLKGRVSNIYVDKIITDLSTILDTQELPVNCNRNFICFGNDNGGVRTFYNVYLTSAGLLRIGSFAGSEGSNAFIDLSAISFPCYNYPINI